MKNFLQVVSFYLVICSASLMPEQAQAQFTNVAGVYNGLFLNAESISHQNSGFFSVKVGTNRSYSGRLLLDGESVPLSGKFQSNGVISTNISRAKLGKGSLQLEMSLNLAAPEDQLTGTIISNGGWTSSITADRAVFNKLNPATAYTNQYTVAFFAGHDPENIPYGCGVGVLKVSTNGVVSLSSAYLPDGQVVRQTVPISRHGIFPLYLPIYKTHHVYTNLAMTNVVTLKTNKSYHTGSVIGWAYPFDEGKILFGDLNWVKPAGTDAIYPKGFTNAAVAFDGFVYQAPAPGEQPFYPAFGYELGLQYGNIEPGDPGLVRNFSFGLNNRILITPTNNSVRLSVNSKTGLINGSFVHPANPQKPTVIRGVVIQPSNYATGFFLGTNQAGVLYMR